MTICNELKTPAFSLVKLIKIVNSNFWSVKKCYNLLIIVNEQNGLIKNFILIINTFWKMVF